MKSNPNRFWSGSLFPIITVLTVLIIPYCSPILEQLATPDIIEFLTIEPGKSTTVVISDLFFAASYDLAFGSDEYITTDYNRDEKLLTLTPKDGFSGLRFIPFQNWRQRLILPVIVKAKVPVKFQIEVNETNLPVFVMGNFNNWSRNANPMFDNEESGIYRAQLLLDDGIYEYQFVIGDREIYDPENPVKVDNGFGYFNSLLHVKSAKRDSIPRLYFLPEREKRKIDLALETLDCNNTDVAVLIDNQFLPNKYVSIENRTVTIDLESLQNDPALRIIRVVAATNNIPGNVISIWVRNGSPSNADGPFIWQDAIIYSLMIDRFQNGNPDNDDPIEHPELDWRANFFGGDFAGITQKIQAGYFDSLGINTLWISPVNQTTDKAYREYPEPHRYYTGYHGYWPVSPTETEPRFGTLEEFKKLVVTAHQHGLKVLLDFVSNHTHIEHEFYQQHQDWYGSYELPDGRQNIRLWDEFRLTTWFDTFLPSFDYVNSPAAAAAMTDNAVWWLKETGIDGFRHDATKHVPYSFWRQLTHKIKTDVAPDRNLNIYQIGETFGGHDLIKSFVNNGMLTAQFSFDPYFTLRRIFTDPDSDISELGISIDKTLEVYGYNHVMGNILDSHDQIRIMGLLEGDITMAENGVERAFQEPKIEVDQCTTYQKAQLLFCYLMTVPGVPIIYYGDEFGMTGANDPDNRRMMRFDGQLTDRETDQLNTITKIIQLRKNNRCLRRGDYIPLYADKDALIYSRGDTQQRIIVLLNKSEHPITIQLQLPNWLAGNTLTSLLGDNLKNISSGSINITLSGLGYDIMLLRDTIQ